jgi:hypothetical protein
MLSPDVKLKYVLEDEPRLLEGGFPVDDQARGGIPFLKCGWKEKPPSLMRLTQVSEGEFTFS